MKVKKKNQPQISWLITDKKRAIFNLFWRVIFPSWKKEHFHFAKIYAVNYSIYLIFNKEKVHEYIYLEICINFQLTFRNIIIKTCVAHNLQCKIQGAIIGRLLKFWKFLWWGIFIDNIFKTVPCLRVLNYSFIR